MLQMLQKKKLKDKKTSLGKQRQNFNFLQSSEQERNQIDCAFRE